MQGSSRTALAAVRETLHHAIARGTASTLAEELFAVVGVLDSNGPLRRALADPSAASDAKAALARRVLTGKVSESAVAVVAEAAAQRWQRDRDLADGLERAGFESVLAWAESRSRLMAVEEQVFRFNRLLAGNPELRTALTERAAAADAKDQLVRRLLGGRTDAEAERLARYAVGAPRGRRIEDVLETVLEVAEERQDQVAAVVTSAIPLESTQVRRIEAALSRMVDRTVRVNVVVDPEVIGGIRVEVAGEVIDGTVAATLDDAQRRLAG